MAAGIEVPRQVGIHGFLLLGEHKMSKSLGNVIDPFQVVELYGADALRFYVLREVRFGQDGEVSPEGFERRYTSELANEYGNLASRTLAMIERYRDGVVPEAEPPPELARRVRRAGRGRAGEAGRGGPDRARSTRSGSGSSCSTATCRTRSPGSSPRTTSQAERLDAVLYSLAEGLRVVSVLLHPFMPDSAERLLAALGRDGPLARERPLRRGAGRRAMRRARPALPEGRGRSARRLAGATAVVDTHCHLDVCEPPSAELVARAPRRRASAGSPRWA